ncbi:phosphotransferase enzyme family protein [Cellulomonas bogoriensis]|uniref:Aminoglycoside phosphotransferase n=1 Tax=Cellulomonas bogoriensis 69B4 = DSM 16987 TaxID=1386082 RepID=A0A0A0C347_9CELL|nr:phosphotransferase [Cellulomonas bogoriensis]KGM13744.1 aminoglycoside phosphotransferase [Cellulomonas bogoriensis 69B4 = DSM 16987]
MTISSASDVAADLTVGSADVSAAVSLSTFDALSRGAPAPYWLHRGVCAAWGLDPDRVDMPLITVSENATFRLDLDSRPVGVVRVSQPGYVGGPEAIASELAWLGALHEIDELNLISPVPTIRGPFTAVVKDTQGNGWVCVSTRFIQGEVLEDLPDPAEHYQVIGRWSALLHDHARRWDKPHGFTRFTWAYTDMVGPGSRWGRWEDAVGEGSEADAALLRSAQERALELLGDLPRTRETWGVIHADLRPSNVMTDGERLTIIDFDDCGFGYFLYDYAAALSFVEHEPYAPAMARAWVAGYQEVAPLSSTDLRHASALSMLRRLTMLGWTTNHRADALPDGLHAAQLPGTLTVARRFLESPTWLLD